MKSSCRHKIRSPGPRRLSFHKTILRSTRTQGLMPQHCVDVSGAQVPDAVMRGSTLTIPLRPGCSPFLWYAWVFPHFPLFLHSSRWGCKAVQHFILSRENDLNKRKKIACRKLFHRRILFSTMWEYIKYTKSDNHLKRMGKPMFTKERKIVT